MKVRLNNLKVTELENDWGTSYKINFKQILPEGHRWVSGFLTPHQYDTSWVDGAEKDLEIFQKGDYWNFKINTNQKKSGKNNLSGKSIEQHEEVMDALKKLYSLVDEMNKKIHVDKEPGIFD